MDEDILGIIFFGIIFFTLAAGFTIRLALKPMVDSIARLLEVRMKGASTELLEKRIAMMEREVTALRDDQQRLAQERDFYRELQRPGGAER